MNRVHIDLSAPRSLCVEFQMRNDDNVNLNLNNPFALDEADDANTGPASFCDSRAFSKSYG